MSPTFADVSHRPEQAALQELLDFYACVDQQGRFLDISERGLTFIGYHREYLQILSLRDLVLADEVAELERLLQAAALSGELQQGQLHLVKTLTYPQRVEIRFWKAPGSGHIHVLAYDVSNWVSQTQSLSYSMDHDVLTGLPNLRAANREIEKAQQQAKQRNSRIALLLLDIASFHRINRAFSYEAGDRILRDTASRLKECCGNDVFVARAASDAFLILLRDVRSRRQVEELATKVSDVIQTPYSYEGQTVQLTVHMGATIYPDGDVSGEQLYNQVDAALGLARRTRGVGFAFYEHEPAEDRRKAIRLESDLHTAIRNGEFTLHYQPIVRADNLEVVAVEALMRWRHPSLGMVPPDTFIPVAEQVGLINFLGDWALKNACMQLKRWDAEGIVLHHVNVNVSAQQFRDRRFADHVREAFKLSGLAPNRVVLEITESVLMQDPVHAKAILEELTELGVGFAMDDFGTGYSSLAYLQSFPLTTLKLDRGFIGNLPNSLSDRAIVDAVIGISKTLGLSLVAEGVETDVQRNILLKSGCQHIQGWLVCKALPVPELSTWLRSHASLTAI